MLELAILGLLLESPMHGYELRKRLTGLLGAFRAFSYGSLYPALRRNDGALMTALAMIVAAVVVNRWNVTLSGLVVPPEWSPGVLGNLVATSYTPSWTEVAVTVGVLGYGLLAFTLGVKFLPIFQTAHQPGHSGD